MLCSLNIFLILLSLRSLGQVPLTDLSVKGFIDKIAIEANGVRISGRACQNTVSDSIDVHLYATDSTGVKTFVGSGSANLANEASPYQICGTVGMKHRYSILIAKDTAVKFVSQKIAAHGLHIVGNVGNLQLNNSNLFSFPKKISYRLSELVKNGDDLEIEEGMEVVIDQSYDLGSMMISGRLICPQYGKFILKTTGIHVMGDAAAFECGTNEKRFAGSLQILLKPGFEMMGSERTIMVMQGGTLRLIGQTKNSQWLKLRKTALAGEDQIHLTEAVNWSPGDQVVMASTNYNMNEAEQRTIKAILNNGMVVQFTQPLSYTHWGTVQSFMGTRTWKVDQRAEVANLTRNIVIAADGEESTMDYRGGHVMVMRGAYGYIDGVEFFRMGRMGEMARYPFHWHRAGDVSGQYIVNSSIHRSFQRCITIHGTNQALVENNVCYDHYGHGFFLEDGDEVNNIIRKNLGMLSRKPLKGRHLLESDINVSSGDRFPGPSTYWISNPKNIVANNVAAGSEGTGFWMSFVQELYCEPRFCKKPAPGFAANVFPAKQQTLQFQANVAHSNAVGMTWDGVGDGELANNPNNAADRRLVTSHYSPPTPPVFSNLRIYKSRAAAVYVRSNTSYFNGAVLADNKVGFFFAYNQVVKSSAVVAKTQNHQDRDYAYNSEFTGVRLYDGPFDMRDIDFLNFPSQPLVYKNQTIVPTPFMLIGGANRFTNAVQGLRFFPEPVRRIDFSPMMSNSIGWADANHSPSIRDIDGSLAGRPNMILVPDDPFNNDPSCVKLPQGTMGLQCGYQRGLFIFLSIRDNVPWEQTPFVVKRSDGPSTRPLADLKNYFWNLKYGVILGERYSYDLTFAPEWKMPGPQSGGLWWPNSFQIIFQTESIGQISPVVSYTGLGNNCSIIGWKAMGSLANLKMSRENSYYNAGTKLYARFVASEAVPQAGSKFARASRSKNAMVQCSP